MSSAQFSPLARNASRRRWGLGGGDNDDNPMEEKDDEVNSWGNPGGFADGAAAGGFVPADGEGGGGGGGDGLNKMVYSLYDTSGQAHDCDPPDEGFCFLCTYGVMPGEENSNVFLNAMQWSYQHYRLRMESRALWILQQRYYDKEIRESMAGKPRWSTKAIKRHYTSHKHDPIMKQKIISEQLVCQQENLVGNMMVMNPVTKRLEIDPKRQNQYFKTIDKISQTDIRIERLLKSQAA